MSGKVKNICIKWVDAGAQDDCFWEAWPSCPTPHDDLTPLMVLSAIEQIEADNERLKAHIKNRISEVHENILCEALAEIKATVDGDSNQTVKAIVYGALEEIDTLG